MYRGKFVVDREGWNQIFVCGCGGWNQITDESISTLVSCKYVFGEDCFVEVDFHSQL